MASTAKPAAAASEDELLRRRIAHCKRLLALFENPSSVASQSVAAYGYLLDECLTDLAIEVHREALNAHHFWGDQPAEEPTLAEQVSDGSAPGTGGNVDVFGQVHSAIALEVVECLNCGRKLAAGRYAPHLEKCLGRGRTSARANSRRQTRES